MTGGLAKSCSSFSRYEHLISIYFSLLPSNVKNSDCEWSGGPLNFESHHFREWLWQPERPMRNASLIFFFFFFFAVTFSRLHFEWNARNNYLFFKKRKREKKKVTSCLIRMMSSIVLSDTSPRCPAFQSSLLLTTFTPVFLLSNTRSGICTTESEICHP